jgi:spore germination protein GerM
MMQLIKTSLANTKNQKIYLYLDGKQINEIGGEGIMISQPLTEKSLD